jgi:hypothetical protein
MKTFHVDNRRPLFGSVKVTADPDQEVERGERVEVIDSAGARNPGDVIAIEFVRTRISPPEFTKRIKVRLDKAMQLEPAVGSDIDAAEGQGRR